jgi:hypothetical protein
MKQRGKSLSIKQAKCKLRLAEVYYLLLDLMLKNINALKIPIHS